MIEAFILVCAILFLSTINHSNSTTFKDRSPFNPTVLSERLGLSVLTGSKNDPEVSVENFGWVLGTPGRCHQTYGFLRIAGRVKAGRFLGESKTNE
jgi:hypothetical protein